MLDFVQRRARLMTDRGITLVLDVGANVGQYGMGLRQYCGYRGRIVSVEPLTSAFNALLTAAASDPLWDCLNAAFGDRDETAEINIAANSMSSSFLPATSRALAIEPKIAPVGKQAVMVRRLDGVLDQLATPDDRILLKLDCQGFELNVLNGALAVLGRFELVQMEVSLIRQYEGEKLIGDMIQFMDHVGFRIVSMEPGWDDPKTAEMLQIDLIFARR